MEKGDVKKASSLLMCALFAGFLLFFAMGYIMIPYQGVNYTEQRYYAKMPELSAGALDKGEFQSGLESYLSDHIILRDKMVMLCSDLGAVTGRRLPELAYRGSGGQFLLRYRENTEGMEKTLDAIAGYADRQTVPVDMLLVPDAQLVLSECLPFAAVNDDQAASAEKIIKALDGRLSMYYAEDKLRELKAQGMQIFYKTDHHWTTDCAAEVWKWYMESSGQQLREVSYQENIVEGFYGSLYSSSPSFFAEPDRLKYYTNPEGSCSVERVTTGEVRDTLFDTNWLIGVKNRYNVFFGGIFDQLRITSDAPGGRLLVLADSYAMPILSLMADQYSDIMVMDLRGFDSGEKTADERLGDFRPDRILFLTSVFQLTCGAMQNFG